MASSASSPATNPSPIFPLTAASSSTMQVQNLGPVIPVRLTETNYLLWKSVFLPVLHKYRLLSIVDGSEPCPPEKVLSSSGELVPNDAFLSWFERDQQLLIWINSTLSESVFPYIIGYTHARDLWLNLEARFAGLSQAHLLHLRSRLQTAKKGTLSMTAYLQLLKGYADSLAALGAPVSDSDLVAYCLQGLSNEYSSFATALRTRMRVLPVTSAELHNLLLLEEIILEDRKQLNLELSAPASAFAATSTAPSTSRGGARGVSPFRGRGRNSSFRGTSRGSFTSPSSRPHIQCQICDRQGHSAIDCYNRMNHAYVGRIPPAKLTALFAAPTAPTESPVAFAAQPTAPTFPTQSFSQAPAVHPPYSPSSPGFNFSAAPIANSTWLADSGASQHVTPDLSHLSEVTPYTGNAKLTVGNGNNLQIAHIGSSLMHTPSASFKLTNVLHVPEITHNLLSVNRFVTDNDCAFVLTPTGSMIKDLGLRRTLSQGPVHDGVYPIQFTSSPPSARSAASHSSPQAHSTSLLSGNLWHARFGQANSTIVNKVLQALNVPAPSSTHSLCVHCMQGKAHRLPFSTSSNSSSGPLQLLHADIWGPASISSVLGYRFFLSLVDDWSRHCWIIPLYKKSDVPAAFHIFKLRLENLLSTSIQTLRCDNARHISSI
ncbi:putative RNA-directed DNA polymerase [Rosa chinensis]|uniref:Putative RNA-directed DNA polymerase n=1 Tax=Rosa chinensis TaxID=74649 RepID=A0A2P6R9W2_ROSCH|nr:putative RNA-directed DNA polymerase [Rosa chinensis]